MLRDPVLLPLPAVSRSRAATCSTWSAGCRARPELSFIPRGLRRVGFRPGAENGGADADMGGAECNRSRIIRTHPHGQKAKPIAAGDLGGKRKMRRRRFVVGRQAHEPRNGEAIAIAAGGEER